MCNHYHCMLHYYIIIIEKCKFIFYFITLYNFFFVCLSMINYDANYVTIFTSTQEHNLVMTKRNLIFMVITKNLIINIPSWLVYVNYKKYRNMRPGSYRKFNSDVIVFVHDSYIYVG